VTTAVITPSIWNHIVCVYDGTLASNNIILYINGNQTGTPDNFTGNVNLTSTDLLIGDSPFGNNANAIFDEFAFWNTPLSSADISSLWASGDGDFANNYSPANLQVYYRCNEEGAATTLIDETGNHNGTLNNFSTPPAYFIPH